MQKNKLQVSKTAQNTGKNISLIGIETSFDFLFIHQPFYEAGIEPVIFKIDYLEEIDTQEFLSHIQDEVTFKTQVTKKIEQTLYKK